MQIEFNKEMNDEETIKVLTALATAYDSVNGTRSTNPLLAAIQTADWSTVIGWDFDYSRPGRNVADLIAERQLQAFFKKLMCLPLGVDTEQAGYDKFMSTERACSNTNEFFRQYNSGKICIDPSVESILLYSRLKIAEVLGPVPKLSQLKLTFGPGATTSVKKRNACARTKLSAAPSCNTNMVPILGEVLRALPQYASTFIKKLPIGDGWYSEVVDVEIHPGGLSFVPKDATIRRPTVKEPTLPAMVQRGYGRHIAARMRRVGIDLKSQEHNQRLARSGSLNGDIATVDSVSASDMIATLLVDNQLPFDWYTALDLCRTTQISYGKETINLQKFSTAGNGYTFELESLIFWSLAKTTCEHLKVKGPVSVFGDDLIVPVAAFDLLQKVFRVCGFEINAKKSYSSGPFRESCGKDYFMGVDIRPKYMDDNLSFMTLFDLHNYFVRNHDQAMADAILEYIPEDIRLWGPDGFGDGHLISDRPLKPFKRKLGYGGWIFDSYAPIVSKHKEMLPGDFILPCYTIYASGVTGWAAYGSHKPKWHFEREPVWPLTQCGLTTIQNVVEPLPFSSKDEDATKSLSLPEVTGYKRISIYTLKLS